MKRTVTHPLSGRIPVGRNGAPPRKYPFQKAENHVITVTRLSFSLEITVILVSGYRDSVQLKIDTTVIWFSIYRDSIQANAPQPLVFPMLSGGQPLIMLFQNHKPTSSGREGVAFFGGICHAG
jgi:hypothetical protein